MVADPEKLDAWMLRGTGLSPGAPLDLLRNLQRARELRAEVERARTALHQQVASLRRKWLTFVEGEGKRPHPIQAAEPLRRFSSFSSG